MRHADLLIELKLPDEVCLERWNTIRDNVEQENNLEQNEELFKHKLKVFNDNSAPVVDF